jgi:hypothetical protein
MYQGYSSAFTRVSQALTNKFFNMDRIMVNWSPYLTYEESERIVVEMEKRARSKYEGNWTNSDCMMFLRELMGNDRVNAIEQSWLIDNQAAVEKFGGGLLREAWVHKLSMAEGTPEQVRANPDNYILIKTTDKV